MNRRLFMLLSMAGLASATFAQACPESHDVKITKAASGQVSTSVTLGDNVQIRIGENLNARQGVVIVTGKDLHDLKDGGAARSDMD